MDVVPNNDVLQDPGNDHGTILLYITCYYIGFHDQTNCCWISAHTWQQYRDAVFGWRQQSTV